MTVLPGIEHVAFISHSPGQTQRFGAGLGRLLEPGDLILLKGTLGAGKTTLVQGIAAGAGATDRVTSPSFTLINEYAATPPIYHVDLFRLSGVDEEMRQALEGYEASDGVTIVEWPESLPRELKAGGLRIDLDVMHGDLRGLTLHTEGSRWRADVIAAVIEAALRPPAEGEGR